MLKKHPGNPCDIVIHQDVIPSGAPTTESRLIPLLFGEKAIRDTLIESCRMDSKYCGILHLNPESITLSGMEYIRVILKPNISCL